MKKLVHNITISVFEKNIERIKDINLVFYKLLPIDFVKENISINHEKIEGMQNQIINILTLDINKQKHTSIVLQNLFDNLSINDKKTIKEQYDLRLDNEGHLYIRIDKNQLFHDKYSLTDSGDCFHFKIKIAAFPAKRDSFVKSLFELFETLGCPKINIDNNSG